MNKFLSINTKRVSIMLLLAVLLIVGATWGPLTQGPDQPLAELNETPPSGTIFLNLTDDTNDHRLYAFDVVTKTLQVLPYYLLSPSFTADEKNIIGATYTYDAKLPTELTPAILRGTGDSFSVLYASTTATQLFRSTSLSPDGTEYMFAVRPDIDPESQGPRSPDLWSIYTSPISDGTPTFITHGAFPHYSPDGSSMLYLKHDGLHVYSFVNKTDQMVVEYESYDNMMLAVSRDGKYFAFASPFLHELFVGGISSWTPFTIKEIVPYDENAFWPVFSPDGAYIAFQAYDDVGDTNGQAHPANPRLMILDPATGEVQLGIDLSAYDQDSLFINDWIRQESAPNFLNI